METSGHLQTSPHTCSEHEVFWPLRRSSSGQGTHFSPLDVVAPRTYSSPSFYPERLTPYKLDSISYNKNGNANIFSCNTYVLNNRITNRIKSVNKTRGAQKSTDFTQLAHKSRVILQSDRGPKGLSQPAHLEAQKSNINDPKNCGQNIRPSTKGKIKTADQAFSQRGPMQGQTIVLGRI